MIARFQKELIAVSDDTKRHGLLAKIAGLEQQTRDAIRRIRDEAAAAQGR